MVEHLTRLLDTATVVPAVNQIEVHPYFQQRARARRLGLRRVGLIRTPAQQA